MINLTPGSLWQWQRERQHGRCVMALVLALALAVVIWIRMSPMPLSLRLLRLYPKKTASAVAGWLADRTLPQSIRGTVLGAFAGHYNIDLNEAEYPLQEYPSLQAFFTRRLKPGLRPQAEPVPGFINSPVDAAVIACGTIDKGTLLQAKGLPYRLPELLKHLPALENFEGGHYLTLYLSPRDYHRIHVPLEGRVKAIAGVEGELWPVNDASTGHVDALYVRNRRATWFAEGTGMDEGLHVAAVMVGATHVGGIVLEDRWREGRPLPKDGGFSVNGVACHPGEALGYFQFGSTVVLLVGGPQAKHWRPVMTHGAVKVGQRLGAFEKQSSFNS